MREGRREGEREREARQIRRRVLACLFLNDCSTMSWPQPRLCDLPAPPSSQLRNLCLNQCRSLHGWRNCRPLYALKPPQRRRRDLLTVCQAQESGSRGVKCRHQRRHKHQLRRQTTATARRSCGGDGRRCQVKHGGAPGNQIGRASRLYGSALRKGVVGPGISTGLARSSSCAALSKYLRYPSRKFIGFFPVHAPQFSE